MPSAPTVSQTPTSVIGTRNEYFSIHSSSMESAPAVPACASAYNAHKVRASEPSR